MIQKGLIDYILILDLTMKSLKNKNYIYLLKIIACFLVIINHTNSNIFLNATTKLPWFISIITFFLSKMAIPIFMMITGALILNKNYDYKKVIKKVFKYITILILISIIYNYFIYNSKDSIIQFIIKIHNNQIYYPLWYLYFYIALLLSMPILQKMVKNMNNSDFIIFFIISFGLCGSFYSLAPYYYPSISQTNYFNFFWTYLGFVLLGYFIEERVDFKKINKMKLLLFSFLLIIFPVINSLVAYIRMSNNEYYMFLDNFSLFTIAIPATALFIIVKKLYSLGENNRINKAIKVIAKTTLIIYLIHGMLITPIWPVYDYLNKYLQINISMYIYEILLFIICFTIAWIIIKIPYLNKLFE